MSALFSWNKRVLLAMIALPLLLPSCIFRPELKLAASGESDYIIVISESADSLDMIAAFEFQRYFHDISGAILPIHLDSSEYTGKEIIIGVNKHLSEVGIDDEINSLKPGGFLIKTAADALIIAGKGDKGTLYGVYTFLEDYLGCRMYAPDVVLIPKDPAISVPEIDETQNPLITFRELHFPIRSSQQYLDWHKLHWKGTNQKDWGMWVHTFDDLVPPEEFFESHPEYFTELNGQRVPYGQLCLSNPEVFDTLVERLRLKMDKLPHAHYWSVSQNDTYYPCECEKCREINDKYGAYSGSMIWFVNKVAAEFPDKTISTLAYQYTRSAPEGIAPADNVNVVLCSIECNRSLPIADDPRSAAFRDDIINWGKITDNILIWDYVVQFRNYVNPFPNLHVLQPNLQFFVDNNAFMMFQQGSGGSWSEFHELRSYLIAKILWDPDIDLDAIMDDFLPGYYGKAGPYIREYIDTMHGALLQSGEGLGIYGYPYDGINGYLSPDMIPVYHNLLNQARQAVEGEPEYAARVEAACLPLEFAVLDLSLRNITPQLSYFEEVDGRRQVREDMRKRLKSFAFQAEKHGIERIEEHGTTPADYVSIIENYLDKSMMPNAALGMPAQLLTLHSEKYPVGGAAALTDGLRGLPDYHFNWLGFEGEDMIAVIDLGEQKPIASISADFLQEYKSWIWLPEDVEYSYSVDGVDFHLFARVENIVPETKPGLFTRTFVAEFEPIEARYLKVFAKSRKTCPSWHIGSGLPCWIFIDEVVIN